ncbi:MAG: hypothetical protein ACR2HD_08235 [Solirubrobacteraceae bacterium]
MPDFWLQPQRLPPGTAALVEVDRHYGTVAALTALADKGSVEVARVQEAIGR